MREIFILEEKDGPFQQPVTPEEEVAIDRALGLNAYVVRISDIENTELLELANKAGIIPQAYLRQIVQDHLGKL